MRECAYKQASNSQVTTNLQLNVSEAAAFHCLNVMRNKTYNHLLIAEVRIKSPYLFETFEHQVPIIAVVPALSMAAIFVAHRLLMIKKGWNVIFIFMNLQNVVEMFK
ncbi:unnamed protein product [Rhizophagus irregularis]|nr:unnamed protein product [Rhizophagus irregularis]